MEGLPYSPYIIFSDNKNRFDFKLKTFFQQEMIKKNILIPWISISYRHGEKELNKTINACLDTMKKIKKSLNKKVSLNIKGDVIKPIFKK